MKEPVRPIELPLINAKVGDRWAREANSEDKGKLLAKVEEWRVAVGYGKAGSGGNEVFVTELGLDGTSITGAEVSLASGRVQVRPSCQPCLPRG